MPRVILDWDPKYKKCILTSEFLENIRARISIPNDKKSILRRRGALHNFVDDFLSPISKTGRFDMGLYFELKKQLESDGVIDYEIITTDLLHEQLIQSYEWRGEYNISELSLPLRPYQESAVKRCIHVGYGICIVGTAGGKTLLMASLIDTIRENESTSHTIVMIPANLVKQTYKEFEGFGLKELSMWDASNPFNKTQIILASIETLRANLTTFSERKPISELKHNKKDTDQTYLEYVKEFGKKQKIRKKEWTTKRKYLLSQLSDVNLLLIDEVHGLRKDNVINKVISLFDTRHRFGFTGTMPPNLIDQWNIMGQIGPVLIDVDSAALRSMNFIAQVTTRIINIHYNNPPKHNLIKEFNDKGNPVYKEPTEAYNEECSFLYHNDYRNRVISTLANGFDNNSLIMVDKIEHGEALEENLKAETDKEVYFIRGSVDMDDREKIRALMEKSSNIICVAMSRIFAVGINIKNLHYIIFAQGGKAKVTLIQSIGRGLRLHEEKERLIIFDIADATHYSEKHLQERMKYYKEEQINYEITEVHE